MGCRSPDLIWPRQPVCEADWLREGGGLFLQLPVPLQGTALGSLG